MLEQFQPPEVKTHPPVPSPQLLATTQNVSPDSQIFQKSWNLDFSGEHFKTPHNLVHFKNMGEKTWGREVYGVQDVEHYVHLWRIQAMAKNQHNIVK